VWSGEVRRVDAPCAIPSVHLRQAGFPYLNGARACPSALRRNAVQIHERRKPLDLAALKLKLSPLGEVRANEFGLRFFACPMK